MPAPTPRPPTVDVELARSLLADQHPDLAELGLRSLAGGWDNHVLRLGDHLALRLPRRVEAAALVAHEQRWLPELASGLPLPVPVPLRVGRPGRSYPWAWSVVPWFEGSTVLERPPTDRHRLALDLGAFVAALHRPAPDGAPANPVRGVPLVERTERLHHDLERLGAAVDAAAVRATWTRLATGPTDPGPPRWLHGDLHPGNLVARADQLVAVIDFGDLTAGDRAGDLAAAWMLFEPPERLAFRAAAGATDEVDDHTWARARAWALALGVAIAAHAEDPALASLGRRTVQAALEG